MIQNRNILCIANPMWDGDYAKTIVELMSVFARENKVLYIDNSYTLKGLADSLVQKRNVPLKRVLGIKKRLRKINIDDKTIVYVLTPPPTLTINFLPKGFIYKKLLSFNGWLISRCIKRALQKLNMNSELINITSFNPSVGVATGKKFNEKLLIYHCYDVIEAASWMKKHGAWLEKKFMEMADAVIFTSQGLYEKKKSLSGNSFIVKNAVNIHLFSKAFNPEINRRKIIGYIGSIDDRLDYALLDYLIAGMPDTIFIFVGRLVDKNGERMLSAHANVKLEGAKNITELPEYLRVFSAGIIPFIKNEFTKGIYPLKINEYLAAGLPVIATDFGCLEDFKDVISIACTKETFREKAVKEIAGDSLEKKQQRLLMARQNSWEKRVDEISFIIQKLEKDIV